MAYCRKPHSGRHPPLSKFIRLPRAALTNLLRSGRRSSSRLPSAGIRRRVLRLVDAVALLAARALVVALPLLGLCLASLGFARRCRSSRHALACRLGHVARFARHITLARLARSPHPPTVNNSQLLIKKASCRVAGRLFFAIGDLEKLFKKHQKNGIIEVSKERGKTRCNLVFLIE